MQNQEENNIEHPGFLEKVKTKISSAILYLKTFFKDQSVVKKGLFIVGFAATGFLLLLLGFYIIVWLGFFGTIPNRNELKSIQNELASEVYFEDDKLMGKYFIYERTYTDYKSISQNVIDALIATEDIRFYSHNGIDYRSLFRVGIKTLMLQDESSGGGSTITQQLVKNLYPRKDYGIFSIPANKLKEMITAKRIEDVYSKEEIIELYLNTVSFGENAYGIEIASSRFFNIPPSKLNVEQAATLIGLLKANTTYNPRLYPENALWRRNVVLNLMQKNGYLKPASYDSIKDIPLKLDYHYRNHNQGNATYFREHLRQELVKLLDNLNAQKGTEYNLYTSGLKIYTTLNSKMQEYAEVSLKQQMAQIQSSFNKHWGRVAPWYHNKEILNNAVFRSPRYKKLKAEGLQEEEIAKIFNTPAKMVVFTGKGEETRTMTPLDSIKHYLYFLNAGFMAMDPKSGEVKAWVGGINHKYFKYDHVRTATKRQAGSIFKPIVYAAALEKGIDPCEYVENQLKTYDQFEGWAPKNADHQYGGYYSMEGALSNSVNTYSVELIMKTGTNKVINLARQMGIKSPIPNEPSIALGTPSISLFEMVNAYATFANKGTYVAPSYLLRIEDRKGNVLINFNPSATNKKSKRKDKNVYSDRTAQTIIEMMRGVVNNGTAASLRYTYKVNNDLAGKTGTSQNQADGWFVAFSPSLVTGAWVGSDDPRVHFRTLESGQGSRTALPIVARFWQKLNKDKSFREITSQRFAQADEKVLRSLDCEPFMETLETDFLDDIFSIFRKKEEKRKPSSLPKSKKPRKKLMDILREAFGE